MKDITVSKGSLDSLQERLRKLQPGMTDSPAEAPEKNGPEKKKTDRKKILSGFDGFVDVVMHVVRRRYDREHYERYEHLRDYGEVIAGAGGLNLSVEMLPIRKKIGGNGVQMAEALAKAGEEVTYIGACGRDAIEPVFQEFAEQVTLYSVSDPARTDAIEFADGKIICSQLKPLEDVNWDRMMAQIGQERLTQIAREADALAFGNWASVITMTGVWQSFLEHVAPELPAGKRLFLDLSNPAKRSEEDVREALACIRAFAQTFCVTLGLNRRELAQLDNILHPENPPVSFPDEKTADPPKGLLQTASSLRQELGLDTITVHNAQGSLALSDEEETYVRTPFCSKPLQMTGAGDHYNAGFLFGQIHGFSLTDTLYLATAGSGFYIRNSKSADIGDMIGFLQRWQNGETDQSGD